MGPSINGLDKLIKMPYGCGEQNMLNFAPNIFVRKYLSVTNNLKSDMDAKSKEYMVKGMFFIVSGGRRGPYHMVVRYNTTYVISAYHH